MTTPQSLELFRNSILRQLNAALPASLTAETLALGLQIAGFAIDDSPLRAELLYLEQKSLLEPVAKTLSTTPRYRLTATGRDYLQSEGLA
jgi:hypothetical protein